MTDIPSDVDLIARLGKYWHEPLFWSAYRHHSNRELSAMFGCSHQAWSLRRKTYDPEYAPDEQIAFDAAKTMRAARAAGSSFPDSYRRSLERAAERGTVRVSALDRWAVALGCHISELEA